MTKRQTLVVRPLEEAVILEADPVRLTQIVTNLLTNACKYTKQGGRIELSAEKRERYAVVEVRDNGRGIEHRAIARLFEPFTQMDPQTDRGSGLGIGLYLTKRLTEKHGGRIHVESGGPGLGSTFSVYLPLPPSKVRLSPTVEPAVQHPPSARVLVVDDNRDAADMLQTLLRHFGHRAEAAYSGEEALEKTSVFRPELILLDISMPDMSGYEAAARLRASGWRGTLAALSGYGQERDRAESRAAGFDAHLIKPVRTADILSLIAEMKKAP